MTDFDTVKQAINIKQYIESSTGFRMKKAHLEECPFCSGHECFSIRESEGFFHCFQCGQKGDVFNFIQAQHSCDQRSALSIAAEYAGIELKTQKQKERTLTTREKILSAAVEYYAGKRTEKKAQAYLINQRGHDEKVLNRMNVGWTDGRLVSHLRSQGFRDDDILSSGLCKMVQLKEENEQLIDYFTSGLAIFPHMANDVVMTFSIKDPEKKCKIQLKTEYRHKDWRFYNQRALEMYDEVILVEGENDMLSLMDGDVHNVIAMIGQISEDQLKALKDRCKNKILYIWCDNDQAGDKLVRRIANFVHGSEYKLRIVEYPIGSGKDPDEFVQKTLREQSRIEKTKNIKKMISAAVDVLKWEIHKTADVPTYEEQLEHLRTQKVFRLIADKPEIERNIYVEELVKLGFTPAGIADEMAKTNSLREKLSIYYETINDAKNADPIQLAKICHESFAEVGRFFSDSAANVYLLYHHTIYSIDNNRKFNAMMLNLTGLLPTKAPGNHVWETLASLGYTNGVKIDLASWIKTDLSKETIYLNLNISGNRILKISKKCIEEVENGLNADNILLRPSTKIKPFTYLPDTSIQAALAKFKNIVWGGLACEEEQKYFIMCWIFSVFLIEFCNTTGLLKCSGGTGAGKTTSAKYASVLLYGETTLGEVTAAAAYSEAARNPLLIFDNLESQDMTKTIAKFLLLSATDGSKIKRAGGSDSETIDEKPKSLICITAIEPFSKSELINRTFDINFHKKFHTDGFIEEDALKELLQNRDMILSGIIKLIAEDILPNFEDRKKYMTILKSDHKGHSKERTNAYLSMLRLILTKILRHVPIVDEAEPSLSGDDARIFKAWIDYQNHVARDTETGTDDIVKFMTGLALEYMNASGNGFNNPNAKILVDPATKKEVIEITHGDYNLTMRRFRTETVETNGETVYKTVLQFEATSQDMVLAFDRYGRNQGLKNGYGNARIFSARLTNNLQTMKDANWEIIANENNAPYWKIIHGQRYWRFQFSHYR